MLSSCSTQELSLIHILIEGKDKDVLQAEAEKLASLIEKILG